jgi:transcriptional repressor of cell division inhibition gene dicB
MVGIPIDSSIGIPNNVGMTTSDAIEFFGSKADVAAALGLKKPSIYEWGEYPPELRQIQIEILSGGKLKAEPSCYPQAKDAPASQQVGA